MDKEEFYGNKSHDFYQGKKAGKKEQKQEDFLMFEKLIDDWYETLRYTQGIVINLQKVCSSYDIEELKNKLALAKEK